jgi:hypothetical protein
MAMIFPMVTNIWMVHMKSMSMLPIVVSAAEKEDILGIEKAGMRDSTLSVCTQ